MKEIIHVVDAAADSGNSSNKIIVGGSKPVYIENYKAPTVPMDYKGKDKEWAKSNNSGLSCLHVKVTTKGKKEKELYFGEMASKKAFGNGISGESVKHKSDDIIENTIISLAATTAKNLIDKNMETSEVMKFNIMLGTGLPVKEYEENKREIFENKLIGEHLVEFMSPYFHEKGIKKFVINIDSVMVNREGEAAFNALARFSEHKIINKNITSEMNGKYAGLIDIGKGTTEVIIVKILVKDVDGKKIVKFEIKEDYSFSSEGLYRDYAAVLANLKKYDDDAILTVKMIESSLRRTGDDRGKLDEIYDENENRLSILPTVNKILPPHIDEISMGVRDKITNSVSIHTLYVAGGGSKIDEVMSAIKESFVDRYQLDGDKAERLRNKIVRSEKVDPVFSNVEGYYGLLLSYSNKEKITMYNQIFLG